MRSKLIFSFTDRLLFRSYLQTALLMIGLPAVQGD